MVSLLDTVCVVYAIVYVKIFQNFFANKGSVFSCWLSCLDIAEANRNWDIVVPNATLVNLRIELMSFTHKNCKKFLSDSGIETFKNTCFISVIRAILLTRKRNKMTMIWSSVFGPTSKQSFKEEPFLLAYAS